MRKLILGVGINDADYAVAANPITGRKMCPFYSRWLKMLNRCYNPYYLNEKMTYIDCHVCDEWLTFSNFKAWMEKQDWHGKQLDKDIIIPGNKIYCADACAFVLTDTNNFILTKGEVIDRNVGANFNKNNNRWRAVICVNGKDTKLGSFKTESEAIDAYKKKKFELALMLCSRESDERVKKALVDRYQY